MKGNGLKRECLEFGSFRLYAEERLLLKAGHRIPLTPRVLDVLVVLVKHHGQIVSKETLLESVWPDSYVEEGNINRTVSTLRKNLGSQANGSNFIETVPKTGYRFIAPVRAVAEENEPEILAVPWSAARRPVFWTGTIAALVLLVVLGGSFAPNPFSRLMESDSNDGEATVSTANDPSEPVQLTFDTARDAYPDWRRDGRIRFQNFGGNNQGESHIIDSNGQNQTIVSDIPGMRQGGWTPDGKRLMFWRYDDPSVYLADADGGNEKKLPFIPAGSHWSPDGQRLVYQGSIIKNGEKDWDIFVYDVSSGRSTNLTNNPALDADPSWSPNGKEVVFNSNRSGNFEIYIMNSDGSGIRQLTEHPAWDSHPAFSPDGTQIVFNSNRENADSDVYLMNADGGGAVRVVDWENNEEIGPGCWSPDGTKIAFVSDRSGNDDIYVTNVEPLRPRLLHSDGDQNISEAVYSHDGKQLAYQAELPDKSGELRVLDLESREVRTLLKTAVWNVHPMWSPDGSKIVFQNKVEGKTTLFTISADGSEIEGLIDRSTNGSTASWSPDNRSIVYVSANYGPNQLYTFSSETGEQMALTPHDGWETDPAWSPDGTKIVFACDRQDIAGNAFDICVMDSEGNNERRLLSRKGHDVQPAWSPDGSHIAFVAAGDGNNEIYVMHSDGTGLLRLTRNTADDSQPHWSPDGTKIIFTSNRNGHSAIYEISL
jgi:Tol biopolymer transport system component/DNA-binding winged helix-turn-helix (wHTH) protein